MQISSILYTAEAEESLRRAEADVEAADPDVPSPMAQLLAREAKTREAEIPEGVRPQAE